MSEAGVVRRRRSRAEIEALVAEFASSGLKREAFCRQRGLAVATLDKYRRRVLRKPRSGVGSLLAVELVASTVRDADGDAGRASVLTVESRSGRLIEVRRGFHAETLERLLTVLNKV